MLNHDLDGTQFLPIKMPWSRVQTTTIGESGSLRRHSTMDETTLDQHYEQITPNDANHLLPDAADSVKSPSPLRNSFEPSTEEKSVVTRDSLKSPVVQETFPNRQRFSMLRFRHASDPQMSKTARDQSLGTQPPMPAGKPARDHRGWNEITFMS